MSNDRMEKEGNGRERKGKEKGKEREGKEKEWKGKMERKRKGRYNLFYKQRGKGKERRRSVALDGRV